MKNTAKLLRNNTSGFTFVELLVVIVIMAVLIAASANYLFSTGGSKARDVERKNDIKQVASLIEEFVSSYGSPPNTSLPVDKNTRLKRALGADKDKCKSDTYDKLIDCLVASGSIAGDGAQSLREDPKEGALNDDSHPFDYRYGADQNAWKVCALLENQKDPDLNDEEGTGVDPAGSGKGYYCIVTSNRDRDAINAVKP